MKKNFSANFKRLSENWKSLSKHLRYSYKLLILLFIAYVVCVIWGDQHFTMMLALIAFFYPVVSILGNLFYPDNSPNRRYLLFSAISVALAVICYEIYLYFLKENASCFLQAGRLENDLTAIGFILTAAAGIIENLIFTTPEEET